MNDPDSRAAPAERSAGASRLSSPLRIFVVTERFHPAIGGAEVMLRRLAACWVKSKCQVVVLTRQHDPSLPSKETIDGFEIVRMPSLKSRFLGTIHFIASLRRQLAATEGSFDVVFVSMFKHAAYAALTTKWKNPPAIVLRAEGAGPTGDMAWQDSARFGKRIRLACRRADAFIAPSLEIADELRTRGYRLDAIREVPNGVPIPDHPWRSDRISKFRKELGLPDRPTIVYTGRFHADKGLNDLVGAIDILRAEGRPLSLCLVGDGPEYRSLLTRSRQTDFAYLHLPCAVPSVEPFLRASDLFVLPSYQEGLSVALLEALAIGMPCLASDIPANVGIVPTDMMPLFPIRDPKALAAAIARRLDAPEREFRDQRRIVAERFSIDATARRHLEVLEQVRPPGTPVALPTKG